MITVIIVFILISAVFFALRRIHKQKQQGKNHCSGCGGCAMQNSCHNRQDDDSVK